MKEPAGEKRCRCFVPPEEGQFEKGNLYRWDYIIDGCAALDGAGMWWYAGEIEFYQHFQIISGKGR